VLSPLLFVVYMNRINIDVRVYENVIVGSCGINRLFADDLMLFALSDKSLQNAYDRFSAANDRAGMKFSIKKTEA